MLNITKKRMILIFAAMVTAIVIFAFVWFMRGNYDSPVLSKICNELVSQDEEKSEFWIDVYTNEAGEVAAYRAYRPDTDGGVSHYYAKDGTLLGEWGVMPLIDPKKENFAQLTSGFPNKKTFKCGGRILWPFTR